MPSLSTVSADILNPQPAVIIKQRQSSVQDMVEKLCDELMDHMLGCEACINDLENSCAAFRSLRQRIHAAGGPVNGVVLAF